MWNAWREAPGGVVWIMGLPCAGKTSLALAVQRLLDAEGRTALVLDGDQLRQGLCRGLGFSGDGRRESLRRLREVAHLIAQTGAIAIVAAITPYEAERLKAKLLLPWALLVWADALPEVCEQRDAKGMWAAARAGEIDGFTGVDGPFEEPQIAHTMDLRVRTDLVPPDAGARAVLSRLRYEGKL